MGRKYRFKTRPYSHQRDALKRLLRNGFGGELFMEPRTGKSKVTVDYASVLATQRKIDKVVIVCPARVMDVWVEQFHLHGPLMTNIVVWDAKARKNNAPPPPVRGAFQLNVVIVNYDAFGTPGRRTKSNRRSKANGRFKTRALLRKWMHSTDRDTLMVLDESHRVASPSGSAANMIVSMGQDAAYRILATGTPVTKAKKAHDLYMQYKWFDPTRFADLPTADEFKHNYGRWIQTENYPKWVGARNQDDLQRRIHKTGTVVRREDCFDLPPREVIVRSVPLKKSAPVYDDMAEKMVAEIRQSNDLRQRLLRKMRAAQAQGDTDRAAKYKSRLRDEVQTVEASIKLVQGLRLRQITGGVATTDEGKLIRIGSEKIAALKEEIAEVIEHDGKVVIAAQFRADLSAIERLARHTFRVPTFVLKGGVKRDDATRDIREFRDIDGSAVYVVQPQSGAEGIDLSSASNMVWYSLTPSFVKYTQMCDRIALSRTSTTFTYLLAKGTVDEVLYETLQTDGEVTRAILDRPEMLLRQ